jgi:hypothetical protein
VSASYYHNVSSNQLINYPLPATSGFNGILDNFNATIRNRGLEMEVSSTNVRKDRLTWRTDFNFTLPENRLVSFPGLESTTYASRYVIGEPLSIIKTYDLIGVNPDNGIYQFTDMNNDGRVTTADRLKVMRLGQKYFGGINNTLQLNSWEMNVFFQFVKQTGPSYLSTFINTPGDAANMPQEVFDNRWQNQGDITSTQRFALIDLNAYNAYARYTSSQAYVVDASFIRLKNVSISYRFPERWTKTVSVRAFVQGQNLMTFTKYVGLDPENSTSSVIPPLMTLVAGLQVKL